MFIVLMLGIAIAALFWHGLVPLRYLPFAKLDLAEPASWFVDLRLAALKSDAGQCRATLTAPTVTARAVADQPLDNGCGWRNAVAVADAGGAHVAIDRISCDMAAGLAMWLAHAVQPAAATHLKTRVAAIRNMGVYSCRNIQGSKGMSIFRSQHARANAVDVSHFVLSDGRTLSVARHWKGDSPEARFLHAVHRSACRYFRVALGPDHNAAHYNHFHYDRGSFKACR